MSIKRAFFLLIILFIFAALLGVVGVVFAENTQNADIVNITAERLILQDYYEFGELLRITVSSNGTIAVIDKIADEYYLKVIGDVPRVNKLDNLPERIAIYNNYVVGDFDQSNYFQVYAIVEDEYLATQVPSNVFDIAIDESNSYLYTLTRTKLKRYALDDLGGLNVEFVDEYEFPIDSPVLANRIVAADGFVYMYSTTGTKVHKYCFDEDSIIEVFSGLIINEALANIFCVYQESNLLIKADGIYSNSYSNKVLNVVDIGGDDNLLSIKAVATDGEKLFIIDNTYNAIKVYDDEFAPVKYYGSYGDGADRLKNPSSIFTYNESIYIADSGNNRMAQYSTNDLSKGNDIVGLVPSNPSLVVANAEGVFVASGDQLYFYQDNVYARTHSFDDAIVSITATDNKVFVASGNRIYVKDSGEDVFSDYVVLDQAVKLIAKGLFGNALYIYLGNQVVSYYGEGNFADVTIDISSYLIEGDIVALDADYCGNIYLAALNNIYKFVRYIDGYELEIIYNISNITTISDMRLYEDGSVFLAASHSLLTISDIAAATEANSGYANPTTIEYPIRIAKGNGWIQKTPNNFEDITYISDDEYLMVFNSTIVYQQVEYLLVEYNQHKVYIPKTSCQFIDSSPIVDQYVKCVFDSVNIYQYPSATAEVLFASLTRDDIIEVTAYVAVNDLGEDIWGWYQVSHEGRLGYVQITSVVSAERPFNPVERYYVKARSSYFGQTVKIYSAPDIESEIIFSVSDGTTIELEAPLDKSAEFSKVRINGTFGYVLTDNLMEKGLTDGQILAIVLSTITVVASVVLLLMFKIFKKQKY